MRNYNDLKGYSSIAIMGGTFNPIHNGHLLAAEVVRNELNVEKVVFIPTGKTAYKENSPSYNEYRYIMTQLAVYDNPYFTVSRTELDREGICYSVDTVEEILYKCDKNVKLYFITGADAIEELHTWKNPEKLLSLCNFVAVTRPGHKKLNDAIKSLEYKYNCNIRTVEIPALSISSTDIRNRIVSGLPIKYLVPDAVEKFICKNSLYSDYNGVAENILSINRRLYKELTPKRFKHTQGVASEAAKLALRYGENKDKAYIAGLLHDCAKCYDSEQQLSLCHEYGIEVDKYIKKNPGLAHAFLGEKLAKYVYGITDKDILSSIKYHTTGRADMTMFEKIIYIADCIEPYRENYPGLDEIRKYAYSDIDKALICAFENTIKYNKKKGAVIHPLTQEALDFLKEEKKK